MALVCKVDQKPNWVLNDIHVPYIRANIVQQASLAFSVAILYYFPYTSLFIFLQKGSLTRVMEESGTCGRI